jgi:hypothetical protein
VGFEPLSVSEANAITTEPRRSLNSAVFSCEQPNQPDMKAINKKMFTLKVCLQETPILLCMTEFVK